MGRCIPVKGWDGKVYTCEGVGWDLGSCIPVKGLYGKVYTCEGVGWEDYGTPACILSRY